MNRGYSGSGIKEGLDGRLEEWGRSSHFFCVIGDSGAVIR